MSTKVRIRHALIILIPAGLILLWLVFRRHGSPDLTLYIPASARTVVLLNAKTLYRESPAWLKNRIRDSSDGVYRYFRHIGSMKETGLHLQSGAAYVEYMDLPLVLLAIRDRKTFEKCLSETSPGLLTPVTVHGDFSICYAPLDSVLLVWNHQTLLLIPRQTGHGKIPLQALDILNTREDESFRFSRHYRKNTADTVAVWLYCSELRTGGLNLRNLSGHADLKNGIRLFASEDSGASPVYGTFPSVSDSLTVLYAAPGLGALNSRIMELAVWHLGSESDEVASIAYDRMYKILTLGGETIRESGQIVYEYDEEFNRKAIVRMRRDTVTAACLTWKGPPDPNTRTLHTAVYPAGSDRLPADTALLAYVRFSSDSPGHPFPAELKFDFTLMMHRHQAFRSIIVRLNADDPLAWLRHLKF